MHVFLFWLVFFEPTSADKILRATSVLDKLKYMKPNVSELKNLVKYVFGSGHVDEEDYSVQHAMQLAEKVLMHYVLKSPF